jgi:lysozyme family protein
MTVKRKPWSFTSILMLTACIIIALAAMPSTTRNQTIRIWYEMANYQKAISLLLKHEGGFTIDHAGATNYGVTLRSLDVDLNFDGKIDADDIRNMTVDDAIAFYKRRWWDQYGYEQIKDDAVASKVFDLAVTMGARQAATLVQRALRACGMVGVDEDGKLGPESFRAINAADPEKLIVGIRSEAAGFYRGLVMTKNEFSKYKDGWLNRAYNG